MSQTSPDPVTAAILVIGDEILSGRTKDKNIGWIAERLTEVGVDVKEVRVVSDDQAAIVDAVRALSAGHTYVFTTGGIGPTHDDITADAIAAAFGVGISHDSRAVAMLREIFPAATLNEARMRMARIPDGADLIVNRVSKAPGFRVGNVHVMAGVPSIMQAMMEEIIPTLRTGPKMLSHTVLANAKEGEVGTPLGQIQKAHPEVAIGSYPFQDERGYNTNLVVRGRDEAKIAAAVTDIEAMLATIQAGRVS